MADFITDIFSDRNKYDVTKDYAYGKHELQKFDLVIPKDAEKDINIFIRIHGGAWIAGEKENCTGDLVPYVKKRKMAGLNINYRIGAVGTHISDCRMMLDDIHNAIKCAVEICEEKGYSLKKAIVAGESAGAHLALMYSYKMQYECPVEIGLVYSNCAPTDMSDKNYIAGISNFKIDDIANLCSILTGEDIYVEELYSNETKQKVDKVCPLYYMNGKIPPTMVISCGKDVLVPVSNAEILVKELEKYGVDHYYACFKNSTHCGRDKKDFLTTAKFDKHFDEMIKKYIG